MPLALSTYNLKQVKADLERLQGYAADLVHQAASPEFSVDLHKSLSDIDLELYRAVVDIDNALSMAEKELE